MNKKTALFKSAISLILCFLMLLGSTYAWFTDSTQSASNIITSGTLNVEMYWTDDLNSGTWYNVEEAGYNTVFSYDNWEPGYTDVKYIKLVNAGNLAMNYKLTIAPQNEVGKLAEVINVYFANGAVDVQDRSDLSKLKAIGLLNNVLNGGATANGTLLAANQLSDTHPSGEVIMTIAMSMITTAGNEYQGKDAGNFTITALATQAAFEQDSFGANYDGGATLAVLGLDRATASVAAVDGKVPAGGVTMIGSNISAYAPAGVAMEAGADQLTLTVSPLNDSNTGFTPVNDEVLIPVDVHIDGVAKDNTVPVVINLGAILPQHLNMGNYRLYHVENGVNTPMTLVNSIDALTSHNTFTYDPLTGEVSVAMATFSEVAVIAETNGKWEGTIATAFSGGTGTEADPYLIANADQFAFFNECISNNNEEYGDKHYRLLCDIDIDGVEDGGKFYPIGYHKVGGEIAAIDLDEAPEAIYEINEDTKLPSSNIADGDASKWYTYGGAFKGVFDGAGHTISNIYQNTWALKGNYDGNYWNAAMGLFGYVYGGTIKNLTVDNFESDGEFTPTGVIAAYAAGKATFENIAITNCNPRVYNTGNGGIIGIAGNTSAANDDHITLKNITVDNSNKISALWGSYDVACGGLVGMYRGNVDGSGNATDDTISFDNCHVAAKMDVYNDVCGNYQYYWYRYSGMIIGSIRHNKTVGNYVQPDMTGITANGCTVHFGEWNNYYYCEFEKNGHPSYSGPDDYKFSRVDNSELVIENGKVTGCSHNHTDVENNRAIYLPFDQLFTGYGWGVKSQGLKELEGIKILDIELGNQDKSEEKFVTKFTGDFLYRVGNQNTVSVGSLFAAKDGATINSSGVVVTIDKVDENTQVSGVYTANADWTKGTIQFNGTGVVKVTIQDYNFCTPTVLYLEVVDAVNATGATNATANNVVLLSNVGASSLSVKNGYTFYGNDFNMTFSGDGSYKSAAVSYGFVTVENGGVLDNVNIICDIFPESYVYTSEMNAKDGRYPYGYSAVVVSGNSTISNCDIEGARNNIQVGEGNVTIENTSLKNGSLSNIHIKSTDAYTVTLNNVTTSQEITTSTYDTSKKVYGFGILVGTNESTSNAKLLLEGKLKQENWISKSDANIVSNSYAQTAITGAFDYSAYVYNEKINTGIVYLNEQTASIEDNRSDKETVIYQLKSVTMMTYTGQVYSIVSKNSSDGSSTAGNKDIMPTVVFAGENENITTSKVLNNGIWETKLSVDLDNIVGGTYNFTFADLKVQKYGKDLNYTVKDGNDNAVDKDTPITLNQLQSTVYTLVVSDNQIYNNKGELTGETVSREMTFVLSATKTSIEPPKFTNAGTATGIRLVDKADGDWRPAYPVLTGVSVTYWSASESKVKTVDLSTLYNNGTISSNVWTYTCDDYTLTITGGQVHSDGTKITPVISENTLYFASTNKEFTTATTTRSIILTYVFTDKNDSTTWNRTETVTYSNLDEYDYSTFQKGTLEKPSSSCVTPDTLITLANGKQVRVDSLKGDEMLLVWNLETGKYESAPIVFVDNDAEMEYEIVHLYFSDGSDVKVISEHGFFDLDLGKYVYIDAENYADYVGHKFVKIGDVHNDTWKVITLDKVVIEREVTTAWSPVTFEHLCYYTNGVLSMPGGISGLFNIFEVDTKTMIYDAEQKQQDIETYGLFTIDDFGGLITEEAFNAFNGAYLKVAMGKGLLTWEDIVYMAERYIPLM